MSLLAFVTPAKAGVQAPERVPGRNWIPVFAGMTALLLQRSVGRTSLGHIVPILAILTVSWGGRRYPPYAFSEHGIALLSSVLRSPRAVQVNIEIMRAFIRLRRMLAFHRDLARRLDELERGYDAKFKLVFEAIRQLMAPPEKAQRSIGFRVEEGRPAYGRRRRIVAQA